VLERMPLALVLGVHQIAFLMPCQKAQHQSLSCPNTPLPCGTPWRRPSHHGHTAGLVSWQPSLPMLHAAPASFPRAYPGLGLHHPPRPLPLQQHRHRHRQAAAAVRGALVPPGAGRESSASPSPGGCGPWGSHAGGPPSDAARGESPAWWSWALAGLPAAFSRNSTLTVSAPCLMASPGTP